MSSAAVVILALVTAQRLGELWLSSRNTRRLLDQGAVEHGARHYPMIVALHAAWLAVLWWWAPGRPVDWTLLTLFVLLQLARLWVIATLGPRWTTRIIILPSAPLIRAGPYRYLNHPNYLVVALEIAVLPLAFGLVGIALAFTILNAIVLWIRIRAEETALQGVRQ